MHTVQLPLMTTKQDAYEIDRRFHAISHIHNVLVKHVRRLLCRLSHDKEYQGWLAAYVLLKKKEAEGKDGLTRAEAKQKTSLSKSMSGRRKELALTKAGLESYSKVCGKRYRKLISSQQVQAEAARVWQAVEDVLFKAGAIVHFKGFGDFRTISGKSNTNGAKFLPDPDAADGCGYRVSWIGLDLRCRLPKKASDREYVLRSLDHTVRYCMIKRRQFSSRWRYYAIVVLDGDAPVKQEAGSGTAGIDPGVSTMAVVAGDACFLEELAPKAAGYEKKISGILRRMDESKRATNPGRFNEDGTYKKGLKGKWKLSSHYMHLKQQLRTLYRKKAEYTIHTHRRLCNRILQSAKHFYVEKMDYAALQKRAKDTKRQEKALAVEQKDGSVKMVRKYKRKKRFGHSLNSRSPSRFLTELERKALSQGGSWQEVHTRSYRASQYDHVSDTYTKIPLSQREKAVGGHRVQRDLYSAFLIQNPAPDLKGPDREKCRRGFPAFLKTQDSLLSTMKEENITMRQCFGF